MSTWHAPTCGLFTWFFVGNRCSCVVSLLQRQSVRFGPMPNKRQLPHPKSIAFCQNFHWNGKNTDDAQNESFTFFVLAAPAPNKAQGTPRPTLSCPTSLKLRFPLRLDQSMDQTCKSLQSFPDMFELWLRSLVAGAYTPQFWPSL